MYTLQTIHFYAVLNKMKSIYNISLSFSLFLFSSHFLTLLSFAHLHTLFYTHTHSSFTQSFIQFLP